MTTEGAAPARPSPGPFVIVIVLTAIVLAGLGLWIREERLRAHAMRVAVEHSYRARLMLTELTGTLNQAESAQRGYVISGNNAFAVPYEPARRTADALLAQLDGAYADDPPQRARVRALKAVVGAKFAEMDDVIRQRETHGADTAVMRVSAGYGRRLMEQADRIVAGAIAAEDRLLVSGISNAQGQTRQIDHGFWALVLAAALGMVAALIVAARARFGGYRAELRLHDAHARLEAIFASTRDAILIFGPDARLESMNAAAGEMLGCTLDDLRTRDVVAMIDIAERKAAFPERVGVVAGRLVHPMRMDRTARHADGHDVPVDIALGLMPLPDGLHVVASLRDISERKAAERLKDEFISTVSHELRTPLTSIVGSLGLLRASAAGALPDAAQRLVVIAESNSRRLIRLINDILDIDRIGSGRTTLETAELDLRPLLRETVEGTRGLAETRHVTLSFDEPAAAVRVTGDSERLMQVVGNLLSNAVRFSPEGGTVSLTLSTRNDAAHICVEDEGPGVAPEFRDRIFGRFAQSGAGAAIAGGTGLGLAISREIVRAHGGDIWFEDREEGSGARFCLSLALAPLPVADTVRTGRILVVEDDVEAASVLRSIVEAEGYAVETCGTAREAQYLSRSGRYDGVVLDLHLPDANGLAAVRALRAFPETRALPVVVVSALARDGEQHPSAHALDVIDWIDKPVDHSRLIIALQRAIHRSSEVRPVILHIDDDPDMLEVTAITLAGQGQMLSATSLAAARQILAQRTPAVVILDLALPDGSGLELLPELFEMDGAAVPTIIYSATDLVPEVGRQFDAVLVKSRRSLLALSDAIGEILGRRDMDRKGGI